MLQKYDLAPSRVHTQHRSIIDGMIWIQYDGTDRPAALELEAVGVPMDDMVLASHPKEARGLTGNAVVQVQSQCSTICPPSP